MKSTQNLDAGGLHSHIPNFQTTFPCPNLFQNQIFFFLLINKLTRNSKQQKPYIFIHQGTLETSLSFAQKPEYATFDFYQKQRTLTLWSFQ